MQAKKLITKVHKVGIYVRVSTEEQAQNLEGSIKSQELRAREFIKFKNFETPFGEIVDVFIDRAKSGKDTNRSELQRMLKAVMNNEIDLVVVSELSRLSRSIKDFSQIWEMMQKYDCGLLSLRENFDTTTAAGEMVLFTIANISQFERKQTSERIKANFRARAERGLHNGGSIPMGYKPNPEASGHLTVVPEEAQIVRRVFEVFLKEQTLANTGKVLNKEGWRIPKFIQGRKGIPRLEEFMVDNVHRIIKNKTYIGIRHFMVNGEQKEVKSVWEPIIDLETFTKANEILKTNQFKHKTKYKGLRYPFLLSRLVFCGTCGDAMVGKSAHGKSKKIPYYEHSWLTKKQACIDKKNFKCKPHRVLAQLIEPLVWKQVEELLTNPENSRVILEKAQKIHIQKTPLKEIETFQSKIKSFDFKIESLTEHLSEIPKDISPLPIYAKMKKMEEEKVSIQSRLNELLVTQRGFEIPTTLKDYQSFVANIKGITNESTDPNFRNKILRLLIQKIEVFPDKIKVFYYAGKSLGGGITAPFNANKKGTEFRSLPESVPQKTFFNKSCSKTLTNGGPGKT